VTVIWTGERNRRQGRLMRLDCVLVRLDCVLVRRD
jgi:hypothetical protein